MSCEKAPEILESFRAGYRGASVGSGIGGHCAESANSFSFLGRGLCAAACAYHPAAISLGLWPGLLQDGASVSVHTCCAWLRDETGSNQDGLRTPQDQILSTKEIYLSQKDRGQV